MYRKKFVTVIHKTQNEIIATASRNMDNITSISFILLAAIITSLCQNNISEDTCKCIRVIYIASWFGLAISLILFLISLVFLRTYDREKSSDELLPINGKVYRNKRMVFSMAEIVLVISCLLCICVYIIQAI